jgi:hypothetical protein
MMRIARPASLAALLLPLVLAGCSLFPTTRKLPIPKAPLITQTATPEELVTRLNQRWDALNSLTSTVEIQASVIKTAEGKATDYPTLHGFILLRKPGMLRVVGQLYGVRAFDMVSDGKNSTLSIPAQKKALKFSNSLKKKSANTLENLRPDFFFDAMAVRGLDPDDWYSVVSDSETVEDSARKHLFTYDEYVLSISRRKADTQQLSPLRVVTFHRDDLEPYQQDIYDNDGVLVTQVFYSGYRQFDSVTFPSTITIKRPVEGINLVLTVEKVNQNPTLKDDQFVVQIPEGTKIQTLE